MISVDTSEAEKLIERSTDRENAKKVVLTMLGVDVVDLIKTEMTANDAWVTGQTGAKLDYKTKEDGVDILGAKYTWKALETGRLPGKMPPFGSLRRWARLKFGNENLAVPIARKIAKQGTKAKGLMTIVFNKLNREVLPKRIAYLTERWIQ